MDNDDSLFMKMYNEPIFTKEQSEKHINNINQFSNWLISKIKE
jgi:hypothetical protein